MVNKLFDHIGIKIRGANPWINNHAVNCIELPLPDGSKRIVNFEGEEKTEFSFDDTKGRAFYIKVNPKFTYQEQKQLSSSQKEFLVTIDFRLMYFEIDVETVRTKTKLENILTTNLRQMSFSDYIGAERSIKLTIRQSNCDAVALMKEETGKNFEVGADAIFVAVDCRLQFLSTNGNCEDECGVSTSDNYLQSINFCDPQVIAALCTEQIACLRAQFGASGGGAWGSITGNINDQTDLINILNGIEDELLNVLTCETFAECEIGISILARLTELEAEINPNLNAVLTNGNETSGKDISVTTNDKIRFGNALLRGRATDVKEDFTGVSVGSPGAGFWYYFSGDKTGTYAIGTKVFIANSDANTGEHTLSNVVYDGTNTYIQASTFVSTFVTPYGSATTTTGSTTTGLSVYGNLYLNDILATHFLYVDADGKVTKSYINQSGTQVNVGSVNGYPTNFTVRTDGLGARYGLAHVNGAIELTSYVDNPGSPGAAAWWGTKSGHDLLIFTGDGSAQAIFRNDTKKFALPNETADKMAVFDSDKNVVSGGISESDITNHFSNTNNPHATTLEQARTADNFFNGEVDMNNFSLRNVPTPTNSDEAVNKAYVDGLIDNVLKAAEAYDPTITGLYPTTYNGNSIQKGDTFRLGAGTMAGIVLDGEELLIATFDNPGQFSNRWMILESNREQSTESVKGIAKIASQLDIEDEFTSNNTDIVTPQKFWFGVLRFLSLSWTWAQQQIFTSAPRFSSTTANQYLKVDANKDLQSVSAIPAADITESSTKKFVPQAVADNDFLVGVASGNSWVKKTLAEAKVILGLNFGTGSGQYAEGNDSRFGNEASISASAIDWNVTHSYKTLSANTTFTFSNAANAKTIIVAITNTASNYTVTWPTVKWSGGVAPTQTIGAKTDVYTFTQINGVIYGAVVQNMS